jgi:hypothetical protein
VDLDIRAVHPIEQLLKFLGSLITAQRTLAPREIELLLSLVRRHRHQAVDLRGLPGLAGFAHGRRQNGRRDSRKTEYPNPQRE